MRDSQGGRPGNGEETTDPGLQAFAVLLRRMNTEINRYAHAFAHTQNLHPTDVQALVAILDGDGRGGALTPGMLRAQLNLTSGAVTACLDRLERTGHISRTRDDADGRVVHLHYAPRAMEVARDYFRPLADGTQAARERFDEAELRTVARFLAAMNAELAELRSD